ncbi:MAG: glycosyltransferase family 2 protein [Pyrobaculum sp.]|jgi:dolichol-phosphate mannosyltransferase
MSLLSVIVPAYNEETNIPILIERVTKALSGVDYELIIVDDGSIDNTADVAKKLEDRHPIRVIRHEHNKGKIEALKTGLQAARGEFIAFLDADMEYPPEALPTMLQKAIQGHDLVVAVRVDTRPFHRRIVSSGARHLAKLVIPKLRRYKDPTTEMILAKRDLILQIDLKNYIKPYIPVLLAAKNPAEVEIRLSCRSGGKSSFRLKWILIYLYELLDLQLANKSHKPRGIYEEARRN